MAKVVSCADFEASKHIKENEHLRLIAAIPYKTRSPIGEGKVFHGVQLYFEEWSEEDSRAIRSRRDNANSDV